MFGRELSAERPFNMPRLTQIFSARTGRRLRPSAGTSAYNRPRQMLHY